MAAPAPPTSGLQRPRPHEIDSTLFQPRARKPGQGRQRRPGQVAGQGQAQLQGSSAGGLSSVNGGSGPRGGSEGPPMGAGRPAGQVGGRQAGSEESGRGGSPMGMGVRSAESPQAQGTQMARASSSSSKNGDRPVGPNGSGSGPSPLRMGKSLSSTSRPASPNPSSSSFPTTSTGAPIYRPKAKSGARASSAAGSDGGGSALSFQEFDVTAPPPNMQDGTYDDTILSIFNFTGDGEVPRLQGLRQPIMLGRNHPDWERIIPGLEEEGEDGGQGQGQGGRFGGWNRLGYGRGGEGGEARPLSAFQKSQLALLPEGAEMKEYKVDREGRLILDENGNPIKKEFADMSKVAPKAKPAGTTAASPGSKPTSGPDRPPPKKKKYMREADKFRMGTHKPDQYWQSQNREKLPYVMDESPLLETVYKTQTDPNGGESKVESLVKREDGKRWIGQAVTAGDESAWIALVLTNDGKVMGVPVAKEYKFELKRKGLDIAYAEANDIIERKAVRSRWAHRQLASEDPSRSGSPDIAGLQRMDEEGNGDDMNIDVKPDIKPDIKPDTKPDVKPDIKPDMSRNRGRMQPNGNDVFGLSSNATVASRLESKFRILQGADVKPRVKRERFNDEQMRGRRGRMGMERMEGEDLDVEGSGPQSDEEGFAVGEDEEDAQKELQGRLKREQDAANRNVGVLEGHDSDDSDDDLFGEKAAEIAAEKKAEKKRKRKLREAARLKGFDVGFDEDDEPDDSDSDTDEERDDIKASQDSKSDTKSDVGSVTGRSVGDSKRSRQASPSGSVHSPQSRAHSPAFSGTRSVSPSQSYGGHQLTAQRALSPGGGNRRSATPGSSSGKSRKRKGEDPGMRRTAAPSSSSRPSPEMHTNKKQRPNTDFSHVSGSLARSSSQYLPPPSTGQELDLSEGHAGIQVKQRKKRASGNKEGRSTPGGSGRGPSPSGSGSSSRAASP